MEFIQNPNESAKRCYNINNNHVFVNTTNPFNRSNTNLEYAMRFSERNIFSDNNEEEQDIFSIEESLFTASSDLLHGLIRNYTLNKSDLLSHEEDLFRLREDNHTQTSILSPKVIKTHIVTSCSKNVSTSANLTFTNECHGSKYTSLIEPLTKVIDEKTYSEKMTYCRPATNFYSPEFVTKTLQRNARLQKLVQKLILVRQREKQEAWNNYINELKNKHKFDSNELNRARNHLPAKQSTPELIKDYNNTRLPMNQSESRRHLLHDLFGVQDNIVSNDCNNFHDHNSMLNINDTHYFHKNDSFCYPMSSQGRLMMLEMKKRRNHFGSDLKPKPAGRYFRHRTIIVEPQVAAPANINENKVVMVNGSTQTIFKVVTYDNVKCPRDCINCPLLDKGVSTENFKKEESIKDQYDEVSMNVEKLREKIKQTEDKEKQKSILSIESKLDALIKSINKFVDELNTKTGVNKGTNVICQHVDAGNLPIEINSGDTGVQKEIHEEQVIYSMIQNGTKSAFTFLDKDHRKKANSFSRIDRILNEEMDKSNTIKRDIESLLKVRNERPCSVHITFDIPTRETSTEVTDSLSKTKLESASRVEKITCSLSSTSERHMTIAVNTDPLGLLALLRVSTEAMKQLLSYMPNLDCYSYLSMLQFPQSTRNVAAHYICNICGAAFVRPSQLSDHIQEHNLGNTRDCCVCRHILDLRRKRCGLYSCQHCGQRFARAYCCELHQQSCARRLGKSHDVSSSLMLLK